MPGDTDREWLETDGLGGYASGTVAGTRTRRYHALLVMAMTPPTRRVVLVNGFDAWLATSAGCYALSSQLYLPDVTHPDGARRIVDFSRNPWPRWTFRVEDGTVVEQEIFMVRGTNAVVASWRLVTRGVQAVLTVRPYLSGRDHHALHHENPHFCFDANLKDGCTIWQPYPHLPPIISRSNATYVHEAYWYRNFQYNEERERGLDFVEDLASPGILRWNLNHEEAFWMLATGTHPGCAARAKPLLEVVEQTRRRQRRRRFSRSALDDAADAYIVRRGKGKSIIAGYPWFSDWGRDTSIRMGLATGSDANQMASSQPVRRGCRLLGWTPSLMGMW
jgi:predicted glycogen debranching enzyme